MSKRKITADELAGCDYVDDHLTDCRLWRGDTKGDRIIIALPTEVTKGLTAAKAQKLTDVIQKAVDSIRAWNEEKSSK